MTEIEPKPEVERQKPPREISSTELFAGQRALVITHAGEQYRLTITRNDKLILQK